jgi:hypothetical protein
VREGHWKLLCEYSGAEPQLYNIDTDAGEKSNVAAANPKIVERLTTAVVDWNNSMPADKGATYMALGKAEAKGRAANRQRN